MVTITIFLVAALIIVLSIPLFCVIRCMSRRRKSRIEGASSHQKGSESLSYEAAPGTERAQTMSEID